jgi:hypothetical protein
MKRAPVVLLLALVHATVGCTVATIDGPQGTEAGLLGIDIELGEVHRPEVDGDALGGGLQAIEGEAILEGDMILGPVDEIVAKLDLDTRSPSSTGVVNKTLDIHFVWPKGIIRYQIDAGFSSQKRSQINAALRHWRNKTPLRFVAAQSGRRVHFKPSAGSCSATVGYSPHQNMRVLVSPACGRGSLIHEIGHVVGLLHEHARCNRNNFVKVLWNNIAPARRANFHRRCKDGETYTAYDYASIMHYGPRTFSRNGKPTLRKLKQGATIGQRFGLSKKDIAGVLERYAEELGGGGGGSDCDNACDHVYGTCNMALVSSKTLNKAECVQFCSGLGRSNMASCVQSADCDIARTVGCFN